MWEAELQAHRTARPETQPHTLSSPGWVKQKGSEGEGRQQN